MEFGVFWWNLGCFSPCCSLLLHPRALAPSTPRESQNHPGWERPPRSPSPNPIVSPRATSRRVLDPSRDGDSPAALLRRPTALSVNKLFPISHPNLPWGSLRASSWRPPLPNSPFPGSAAASLPLFGRRNDFSASSRAAASPNTAPAARYLCRRCRPPSPRVSAVPGTRGDPGSAGRGDGLVSAWSGSDAAVRGPGAAPRQRRWPRRVVASPRGPRATEPGSPRAKPGPTDPLPPVPRLHHAPLAHRTELLRVPGSQTPRKSLRDARVTSRFDLVS